MIKISFVIHLAVYLYFSIQNSTLETAILSQHDALLRILRGRSFLRTDSWQHTEAPAAGTDAANTMLPTAVIGMFEQDELELFCVWYKSTL